VQWSIHTFASIFQVRIASVSLRAIAEIASCTIAGIYTIAAGANTDAIGNKFLAFALWRRRACPIPYCPVKNNWNYIALSETVGECQVPCKISFAVTVPVWQIQLLAWLNKIVENVNVSKSSTVHSLHAICNIYIRKYLYRQAIQHTECRKIILHPWYF
jgi:hypothetical protein